jgi:uncharacterized protein (DUF3084 family)
MKTQRVIIWGLSTLILVLAIAGSVFFTDYQKKQTNMLNLEQERSNSLVMKLHQRDSLVNEYVETFNQIEKDLMLIKEKENLLNVETADPELAKTKKVQLSEDIQLIYSLIEENKKKVADLSRKLKNSGVEIAALNEKVKYLAGVIEERDSSMLALNQELEARDIVIADLNGKMGELETVVETQKGVIDEQIAELNKAFLATGSFKDLEEKGIVVKDGGFLGLGKTKTLHNVESNENFDKIDITTTKTITVNAKKAQLITEHPEGSYEWVEENDLIAYMVINDPREFWKVSKYAVLETK